MRSWDPPFWIGDRQFTEDDLALMKEIVRRYRRLSRMELAATLCENLPWKAPNGKLKIDAWDDAGHRHHRITIHVAVCNETWEKDGQPLRSTWA